MMVRFCPPPLNDLKSISYKSQPQGGLRHVPILMRGTERASCVYILMCETGNRSPNVARALANAQSTIWKNKEFLQTLNQRFGICKSSCKYSINDLKKSKALANVQSTI